MATVGEQVLAACKGKALTLAQVNTALKRPKADPRAKVILGGLTAQGRLVRAESDAGEVTWKSHASKGSPTAYAKAPGHAETRKRRAKSVKASPRKPAGKPRKTRKPAGK